MKTGVVGAHDAGALCQTEGSAREAGRRKVNPAPVCSAGAGKHAAVPPARAFSQAARRASEPAPQASEKQAHM